MSYTIDSVSIIIPVYNAENYLHECIDSALNQTYDKTEVIADRILNYLQWGLKKANQKLDPRNYDLYKDLRVDGYFDNKNPITVAVTLFRLNSKLQKKQGSVRDTHALYGREPKYKIIKDYRNE